MPGKDRLDDERAGEQPPKLQPAIVTTGMAALRKACCMTTRRSASPFARAVWMYSWPSTSSIAERTSRATIEEAIRPRVTTGRTSDFNDPSG